MALQQWDERGTGDVRRLQAKKLEVSDSRGQGGLGQQEAAGLGE